MVQIVGSHRNLEKVIRLHPGMGKTLRILELGSCRCLKRCSAGPVGVNEPGTRGDVSGDFSQELRVKLP